MTESSIHGMNFILNPSTSNFWRLFWSFALFCSCIGFAFYIYVAFTKYHMHPDVVQKISQRPYHEIPFPAVTGEFARQFAPLML